MRISDWSSDVCSSDLVLSLVPAPASAAPRDSEGVRAGRMFVMSVPGLTWTEIERYDLPNLEAFFATAGLADLAPRGVSARSGPGDAYLTISAGSRATTERSEIGRAHV